MRQHLIDLYQSHTLDEIGTLLGYKSRNPVLRLFKEYGISPRPRGEGPSGGNRKGTGLIIPEEVLRSDRKHADVAEEYGCHSDTVRRYRRRIGVRRKQPYTDAWHLYNSQVRNLTQQTYRKHKDTINPDNHPRGMMGVDGAYQVDHIRPVRECFLNNVPPEECAALDNLQMISWKENLDRR